MKKHIRLLVNLIYLVIGLSLSACALAGLVDEFWSGMGVSLMIVGTIRLVREIRYKTNDSYRESMDVEANDERNKYIAVKAWSFAGYWFVMISAVATIVLKLLGHDDLMMMASGSLCLILVLYWLFYVYLRKKY